MKKKLVGIMLAVMVASQGMVAFAAPANNNPIGDQHTTIGIMEATEKVGQASFEVPLYVTTAAISNETALMCPEGYDIKNTSKDPDAHNIGVLSVTVEKIGDWDIVSNPIKRTQVKLTIGDLVLPEVSDTQKSNTVTFLDNAYASGTNAFYDQDTTKLVAIKKGETLAQAGNQIAPGDANYKGLEITGTVANVTRTNKKAAAQFRVTYVVSALDDQGNPIGNTYVGDNKAAAGLLQ